MYLLELEHETEEDHLNIKKFTVDGYPDDYIFDNITERQSKLIELGDIFLALPGGFGTIYELLEVITKNQIEEIFYSYFLFFGEF